MTVRRCAVFALALLSVLLAASSAAAQARGAARAPAHPDWTGLYRFAQPGDLAGFTPINLTNLDEVIVAHLQPWARLKMQTTNGVADDLGAVCQVSGIFRHFTGISGFEWLPAGDKIVMASTMPAVAGVRRIYLANEHPRHLPFTWLGHSIGRWDGDTLVVDTVGFNDKSWLMSAMEPHTEALHVVERIRAVGDGSLLEFTTTVEDRETLTSPYSYSRYYKKTGGEFVENICNGDPGEARLWNDFRKRALLNPPRVGDK